MPNKRVDSNSKIFHVTANEDGLTLAAALRRFTPELSWTKARQLIQARHVQVNGNLALDFSRRIKTGEVLKLFQHPLAPPPRAEDVHIIYLDEYLVIVNKPSGMTSVRHAKDEAPKGRKQKQPTLEDLMPDILAKQIHTQEPPSSKRLPQRNRRSWKRVPPRRAKPRVFPVHRLDRDTSGLMMFALSTEVADQLVTMFQSHSIERTYRAVAVGNVRGMTIESFLARDRGDGLRGSVDGNSKNVQHAVTHVRPVKGLGGYTLIECRLETGRTHQIRIHLCEQGHPLCGERLYTHRLGEKALTDQSGAPRLALHAFQLKLLHPIKGRKICVEAPFPPDLENFVHRLKRERKR